jgi:hypothetical protein
MDAPRTTTRDSLKRAPRHVLDGLEQQECHGLLEIAEKRAWTRAEQLRAADLERKAWAKHQGRV